MANPYGQNSGTKNIRHPQDQILPKSMPGKSDAEQRNEVEQMRIPLESMCHHD